VNISPYEAYVICCNYNKRDKRLEKIIIKDSWYAYNYARNIIKGRWIEAESIIATDSYLAYCYAKDVTEGRLPENMHNAMIIHADDFTKEYFKFIK